MVMNGVITIFVLKNCNTMSRVPIVLSRLAVASICSLSVVSMPSVFCTMSNCCNIVCMKYPPSMYWKYMNWAIAVSIAAQAYITIRKNHACANVILSPDSCRRYVAAKRPAIKGDAMVIPKNSIEKRLDCSPRIYDTFAKTIISPNIVP